MARGILSWEGGVRENRIVDPACCVALVELKSDVGERGGCGLQCVGDAMVVHEEGNVAHVCGNEDRDVVSGERGRDLA